MSRVTNKDETREAIIDAAERLIARYGFQKMTMNDLADEARIGVGTTYLHFSGKAEVLLAVLERVHQRIQEQIREIAHSDRTPSQRLREMLVARVMITFEIARPQSHRREEFRQVIEDTLRERRICWIADEADLFADVLRAGQAQGEFAVEDADETAQTMLVAMNSLMPKNLRPEEFDDPDRLQARTERLAALLLRAVQRNA